MVGVMSGIWCTLNGTGNFIGGLIVDKVGRVRQLGQCGQDLLSHYEFFSDIIFYSMRLYRMLHLSSAGMHSCCQIPGRGECSWQ